MSGSLTSGHIKLAIFTDMRNRYNNYVKVNKSLPKYIATIKGGNSWILLKYFDVMVGNYDRYVKAKGIKPASIGITLTKKTFTSTTTPVIKPVIVDELGYFINPEATPLTNIDFVSLKNKGITCVYYRIFNNDYMTHSLALSKIIAAGLKPYAWVWQGFLYAKELVALGWNICMDLETYEMSNYIQEVAELRTVTKGKTLIICTKATAWDGDQKWDSLIPLCDYIMPMLYLGDYGKSVTQLTEYMKTYNTKYPNKIYPVLETYVSDKNVVAKTSTVLQSEVNACKPYSKGIGLFRYGITASNTTTSTTSSRTVGTLQGQIESGTKKTFNTFTEIYNIVKTYCSYSHYFDGKYNSTNALAMLIKDINGSATGLNCVDYTQLGLKLAKEMGYGGIPYGIYCTGDKINHAIFWITGKEFGNGTWIDLAAAAQSSYAIGSHWCTGTKTARPSWIPEE